VFTTIEVAAKRATRWAGVKVLPVVPSPENGYGMTETYGILMLGGVRDLVVCRWPGHPLG